MHFKSRKTFHRFKSFNYPANVNPRKEFSQIKYNRTSAIRKSDLIKIYTVVVVSRWSRSALIAITLFSHRRSTL